MTRAGLGVSTVLDPEAAAEEACRLALERLGDREVAVAWVVASAAHGSSLSRVAKRAFSVLGCRVVVGGSVEGIVAPDVEVSSYPAVMVLLLAAVEAEPFLVRDLDGEPYGAGREVAARIGGDLAPEDLVVVMPDSLGLNAAKLATGLAEHLGPATILGTGATPARRGSVALWHDGEISGDGVAGFVVRGVRPRLAIAQAGRPVTRLLAVTRARGSWVLGLDGRRALDVYLETARDLGLAPGAEGPSALLVGLSGRNGSEGMLVRNLVGFDRQRHAFSVPEQMTSGDALAFVVLDADAAREQFVDQLEHLRDPQPAFGLVLQLPGTGDVLVR